MKTILIPIFHGHIARNILRTNVLNELRKKLKVVVIAPAFKRDIYEKEFGNENIVIVSSPEIKAGFLDTFFRFFYYYFVDTKTVQIIQYGDLLAKGRWFRYYFARFLTKIFGNAKWLRRLVRFFDARLVKNKSFEPIFDQYRPDLVFIPSITSDDEGQVLRQAKARGIKTMGMVRSWDNITVNKGNIRVYPDKLLVHTTFLKNDVIRYADMEAWKIEVVGMSHFDYYWNDSRIPRDEFFKIVNGDSNKKTIYFMPTGLSDSTLDRKVLKILEGAMGKDPRFIGVQVMLSSHPNSPKPIDYACPETLTLSFAGFFYPGGKTTDKEISKGDMELMASAIYHSDLVVNYQSTSSIDASAFDKPVINIAFDDNPSKSYLENISVQYRFDHYEQVLRSGGVALAHNAEELLEQAFTYISNPEKDRAGRERLLWEQNGESREGNASDRMVEAIWAHLEA